MGPQMSFSLLYRSQHLATRQQDFGTLKKRKHWGYFVVIHAVWNQLTSNTTVLVSLPLVHVTERLWYGIHVAIWKMVTMDQRIQYMVRMCELIKMQFIWIVVKESLVVHLCYHRWVLSQISIEQKLSRRKEQAISIFRLSLRRVNVRKTQLRAFTTTKC